MLSSHDMPVATETFGTRSTGRYAVLTESAASDNLGAARARAHRAEDTGLVTRLLDTHTGKLVEF